jgi:hypothetical protein
VGHQDSRCTLIAIFLNKSNFLQRRPGRCTPDKLRARAPAWPHSPCLARLPTQQRGDGLLPSEPIGPSLFSLSSKKKRQTTLAYRPFRVAVALSCISGVVYLYREMFFVGFSAATSCYHCVHIVFLLYDFDRFSYSLSTASC